MSNTPENEHASMGINFHNGDTMTLQQVIHGMQPQVLIQMSMQEHEGEEVMRFDLDVTGPESTGDLAEMLEFVAMCIRQGEVTSDSRDQDDEPEGEATEDFS